jgi:tetratricopeptide (TPR) repeat protein
MRARVFTDASLAEHAGRFVWLAIDVEETKNAAFLEKFPWEAVPTFLVVDPSTESVAYKWLGTADVRQLVHRFGEAELAVRGEFSDAAMIALAEADRLNGAGKKADAAAAYRRAIDAGGENWAERPRAAESMLVALALSGGGEPAAKSAVDEAPHLPRGKAFANVVSIGLSCALEADKAEPWRAPAVATLEPWVIEALALPNLLGDDRSALYETLVQARDEAGDDAGKKRLADQWLDFLDQVTAEANDAEERLAYDSHRVLAALALGDPARALPALEASERDLPDDYNPPARIADILSALGRYDEALAASDRALAKVYGPRKIRIYEARADIYTKKGEPAAAKKTIEDAIAYAKALPPSGRIDRALKRLEKRLS